MSDLEPSAKLRVLCVGPSPLLAFLGWRIEKSKACKVTYLWPDNFDAIVAYGLNVRMNNASPEALYIENFVRSATDALSNDPFDYVFVHIDEKSIEEIIRIIEPAVSQSHTCIVLNTSDSLITAQEISRHFPKNLIVSAICQISCWQKIPNEVEQQGQAAISIGRAFSNSYIPLQAQDDMMETLALAFTAGSIRCDICENTRKQQWLVCFKPLFASILVILTNSATFQNISEKMKSLIEACLNEFIVLAVQTFSCSIDSQSYILEFFQVMKDRMSPLSKVNDFRIGKEVDFQKLFEPLILEAQRLGLAMPRLETVIDLVSNMKRKNFNNRTQLDEYEEDLSVNAFSSLNDNQYPPNQSYRSQSLNNYDILNIENLSIRPNSIRQPVSMTNMKSSIQNRSMAFQYRNPVANGSNISLNATRSATQCFPRMPNRNATASNSPRLNTFSYCPTQIERSDSSTNIASQHYANLYELPGTTTAPLSTRTLPRSGSAIVNQNKFIARSMMNGNFLDVPNNQYPARPIQGTRPPEMPMNQEYASVERQSMACMDDLVPVAPKLKLRRDRGSLMYNGSVAFNSRPLSTTDSYETLRYPSYTKRYTESNISAESLSNATRVNYAPSGVYAMPGTRDRMNYPMGNALQETLVSPRIQYGAPKYQNAEFKEADKNSNSSETYPSVTDSASASISSTNNKEFGHESHESSSTSLS